MELTRWGVIPVWCCPGGESSSEELSQWGFILVENSPGGESSQCGVVLVGSHLGGSYPGGVVLSFDSSSVGLGLERDWLSSLHQH